ncbi:MAG: hypothetical protein IJZ90_01365 [Clostridia bacterium]|nr:hypothetical protein [Clostridia bacterium]
MKNALKKFFGNRYLYVTLIMLVAMTALSLRLYNLQIVEGDANAADKQQITTYAIELDAPRGSIYDCNGVLLATNRTAYEVLMVNVSGEQSERDAMYLELIQLFEKNDDTYNNPLARYLESPDSWGYSLEGDENAEARASWISGIALKKADREKLAEPAGAFNYLRNDIFEIEEKYTNEEAYMIMCIRYETYTNGLDSLRPTTIATDCCEETMVELSSRYLDFPGITTEKVYFREYVNTECISQVIGYVRAISSEEYEELKDQGYAADDIIGKNGLEKSAEDYLRGTKGSRVMYRDEDGVVRELSYTAPVAGNDVYLTIDIHLQQTAYNSLEETILDIASNRNDYNNFGDCNSGSIVVSDINTGEVLAMVSYPGYDNSIFVQPSSDREAQQAITDLFADPASPSLNRATQGLYSIGSTFKPVVALAALSTGAIDTTTTINCTGTLKVNGRAHTCLSHHGYLNMEYAIAHSCNIFFYQAGIDAGIDVIDEYAEKFGLGEKTGIELAEYEGNRSNPETMLLNEEDTSHVWSDSDTAQTSIGQLYTLFTPIQINRYISALGNGGYLVPTHIIDSVTSASGALIYEPETESQKIDVAAENLEAVQQGLYTMAKLNGGIKTTLVNFPEGFASAKTGTVQTGDATTSSNSVFMCFAPSDEPEIAVSIVVEHGVYGGYVISAIGDVFEEYFGAEYKINSTQEELNRVLPDTSDSQSDGLSWSYKFDGIMSLLDAAG